MDAKLQIVSGNTTKDVVSLKLPTTIGRGKDASLTIAHPMISRQHCRLYESQGVLMLQDLDSTNGTFLDGRRIREVPLPPDTEFTIGPLTFRVQYEYAGDLDNLPSPVFADESGIPASGEVPEFEVLEEDVDFLLTDDEQTAPVPNATIVPNDKSPQKTSPADLLETTTLPPEKKPAPAPKAPAASKPSAPKSKKTTPAKSSAEPPHEDISDEEFEKFFDDI
jgi:predicted component of type VI protein secretion system